MADVSRSSLRRRFDRVDDAIAGTLSRHGVRLLRIALGVVFIWFGALKLVPGLSPAEPLVADTARALARLAFFPPPEVFVPLLGVWEVLIGLGLLVRPLVRVALLLLLFQMPGTLLPLALFPDQVFTTFPFGLTLAGQYIVKNVVLVAAAFVVGGTVRRHSTPSKRL